MIISLVGFTISRQGNKENNKKCQQKALKIKNELHILFKCLNLVQVKYKFKNPFINLTCGCLCSD